MKTAGCFFVDFVSFKCTCIVYKSKLFPGEDKGSFNYVSISFENRDNLILSFLISSFVLEHYTE